MPSSPSYSPSTGAQECADSLLGLAVEAGLRRAIGLAVTLQSGATETGEDEIRDRADGVHGELNQARQKVIRQEVIHEGSLSSIVTDARKRTSSGGGSHSRGDPRNRNAAATVLRYYAFMHESWITSAAGVRSPRIIYGTAWKKLDTERLVTVALQEGFRGIDTACQPKHYNEPGVGAALAACPGRIERSDVYLQTKFTPLAGHDPASIPYNPRAPLGDQVLESCAASLRNLRTDHLDALLLHSPLGSLRQTLEAWRAMETLVAAGTVRQLGISNCYQLELLEALHQRTQVRPAVLQNRFYAQTDYDREIRAFCREHRIIYQSFWTLTANPHLLTSATLTTLASRHSCEPEQVLFRYLTERDVVPLTGTTSEHHMRQDLAIFELELTDDERRAVDALIG